MPENPYEPQNRLPWSETSFPVEVANPCEPPKEVNYVSPALSPDRKAWNWWLRDRVKLLACGLGMWLAISVAVAFADLVFKTFLVR
jgi:hypothetical protein